MDLSVRSEGRRLRILHCLAEIQSGGVEVRHSELVKSLSDEFEHRFVCTVADGAIAKEVVDNGAVIYQLGKVRSVFDPSRYRTTMQIARQWPPDLVHGAVMEGVVVAAVVGAVLRIPVIAEETSEPADRRWRGHLLARFAYTAAQRCIAVSEAAGRYLRDTLRLSPSKVTVIVNGVRQPDLLPADAADQLRCDLAIGPSDVVVGTVSRIDDDHKRISDLITAVDTLLAELPNLHAVIVGDGPDLKALRQQAEDTGRGERFHFVGRHNPADAFYSIFDVFALASQREAFGLVVAEAMRAGLPVVATHVGGVPEVVVDGETGFLVPPLSPDDLADALKQLATDADLRISMGAAGRDRAESLFSSERYIREVEHLYRQVLTTG